MPCDALPEIPAAADGTADVDVAGEQLIDDTGYIDRCDGQRALCAACITRGRKAGVIR